MTRTQPRSPRRPRWQPQPPRGLRPRLTHEQLLDLGLAHVVNLDAIARGEADESMLWQWAGGVLTWSRVAIMLDRGAAEMVEQVSLAARLVERYGRTGRVLFTGTDYQVAKDGVALMDELARHVDRPTAIAAANWSERKVAEMVAECGRGAAANEGTTRELSVRGGHSARQQPGPADVTAGPKAARDVHRASSLSDRGNPRSERSAVAAVDAANGADGGSLSAHHLTPNV